MGACVYTYVSVYEVIHSVMISYIHACIVQKDHNPLCTQAVMTTPLLDDISLWKEMETPKKKIVLV